MCRVGLNSTLRDTYELQTWFTSNLVHRWSMKTRITNKHHHGVCLRVCLGVYVCDSVIGTPFYVMQYVPGRIFKDPLLPGLDNDERRQIYESMCQVLVKIHSVDVIAAGLQDFGKSGTSLLVPIPIPTSCVMDTVFPRLWCHMFERFHINYVVSATSAPIYLVTLTFDLLTLKLVHIIACVLGNFLTNFDVSGTFHSRLMCQHMSYASCGLETMTIDQC